MSSARSHAVPDGPSRLQRVLREALLLVFVGIAVFLTIALASYHAEDPGWSTAGTGDAVRNLMGPAGAWLADVLLSLIGLVAFVFPWLLLLLGVHLYRRMGDADAAGSDDIAPWLRLTALLVVAVSLAALFSLDVGASERWAPQGSGGILGQLVATALVDVLNPVGTSVVLLTLLAATLPIAAVFSWFGLFDRVGELVLKGATALRARWRELRERRKLRIRRPAPPAAEPAATPESKPARRRKSSARSGRKEPKVDEAQLALPIEADAEGAEVPPFSGDPLPPLSVLDPPRLPVQAFTEEQLEQISRDLEQHLKDFGVVAEVVAAQPGPVVTRFELQPAPGVKGAQITNLARDLARALSVSSVRVVEVIEGKSVIGLEIPNRKRDVVMLSEILASPAYRGSESPLTIALGKDIAGHPVVVDLARMPHLLVAGTTGAGKSVAINAMILSMLYKATAEQVRFIFIDPKMLELSVYDGIPHLLTPVVTDMKDAANALRWSVAEMERRYRLMTALGVRNLAGLNRKIRQARDAGSPLEDPLAEPGEDGQRPELAPLPSIVIIIDELADMMMVVGKKVEELIARLAQKARAAGIHLIVATQRPSVDVITGLIKANIPSRIAFQVASKIDSRTILDQQGAETLLGHGDMLYRPIGASQVRRVHGAFVDDHEVHKVAKYLRQVGEPDYIEDVTAGVPDPAEAGTGGADAESDPLYDQAVAIVLETGKASTSWVQRRLGVGYNRAARMIEQMEAAGIIGPSGPGGQREILVPTNND